ncbi:hypothetical protein Tco_0277683 [Tanacetum coccineum]
MVSLGLFEIPIPGSSILENQHGNYVKQIHHRHVRTWSLALVRVRSDGGQEIASPYRLLICGRFQSQCGGGRWRRKVDVWDRWWCWWIGLGLNMSTVLALQ